MPSSLSELARRLTGRRTILAEEATLPLYRVLEEEFERLHGGSLDQFLWTLDGDQILDLDRLALELVAPTSEPDATTTPRSTAERSRIAASSLVFGLLTPITQTRLHPYALMDPKERARLAPELRRQLVEDFNSFIENKETSYRNSSFAHMPLDPFTEDLLERESQLDEDERQHLRRLLLEATYPGCIRSVNDIRLARLYDRIHRLPTEVAKRRAALCLSGGGIRSATFALGVVQGLARQGALSAFHYLSTVSGGGYLGSWLSAWIHHTGFTRAQEELARDPESKLAPEPAPVRHLRAYSNYLSPKLGALSADTWTLIATYLRNLFLNWLVLVPILVAIALVPSIAVTVVGSNPSDWLLSADTAWVLPAALTGVGFIFGGLAVAYTHRCRPALRARAPHSKPLAMSSRTQTAFLKQCLVPLVLAGILLTTAWGFFSEWHVLTIDGPPLVLAFAVFAAVMHFGGWLGAALASRWFGLGRAVIAENVREALAVLLTGALAGVLVYGAADLMRHFALDRFGHVGYLQAYVWLAMPLFLVVLIVGSHVFIGVMSRRMGDPEREWSARYSAWVLIVAVGWAVASGLALFGPPLIGQWSQGVSVASLLAIITGGTTLTLGRSAATSATGGNGKDDGDKGKKKPDGALLPPWLSKLALGFAAPIFAALLVIAASALGGWLTGITNCLVRYRVAMCDAEVVQARVGGLTQPGTESPWPVIALCAGLLAAGMLMARFIDMNKFSLHGMYRARLIRAYLGASRIVGDRAPDPFTGFDEADNLYMKDLWPGSQSASSPESIGAVRPPVHVINFALNLVSGDNLAWQERKAESMTVSPFHSGSLALGYRRIAPTIGQIVHAGEREPRLYGGAGGMTLGTALTISGAAASPNMGYHSSPAVTFLMTLFNARLGWWLGNPGPRGNATFDRRCPNVSVRPIRDEMFGFTNDRNEWVYLSDGGHFENLALYEMVLRRCKVIVVSDASCDADATLADLGTAIRRIRVDFGIPIDFPKFEILGRPESESKPGTYWSVGRIGYSCVDTVPGMSPEEVDGTIIYLKPCYYGGEPRDVYNYARLSAAFPHESTTDQFFSESQFESYRALGRHVVAEAAAKGVFAKVTPPRAAEQPLGTPQQV
jgi:hypothetical protein